MRPYLLPKTTDEELISQMGKAVAAETERGKRLPQLTQKHSKVVRLQGIEGTHHRNTRTRTRTLLFSGQSSGAIEIGI